MEDPQLTMQAMAIAGGLAGGVVVLGNAAIRLAEKAIARRNGSAANGDAKVIHEDIKLVHADLKECAGEMHGLTRAADGFKLSHVALKELAQEQVTSNRKFHTQFAIFLERFGTHCVHMEDKE